MGKNYKEFGEAAIEFAMSTIDSLDIGSEDKRYIQNRLQGRDVMSVSAGYLYDRKGNATIDDISKPRRNFYGSENDDMVVQLTFVIKRNSAVSADIAHIGNALNDIKKKEALAKAEEEFELAQKRLDEARKSLSQ